MPLANWLQKKTANAISVALVVLKSNQYGRV